MPTPRQRISIAGMVIVAVLTATPGVHLFELWLPHRAAVLVSHGIALVLLGLAAWRWWRWRGTASVP